VLAPRAENILKSIIERYIECAVPVSSQLLVDELGIKASSATVRNEMAFLEQERYIIRPHTSAGSIPSDKGYRYYVASLNDLELPLSEQRMINHLFHQVEWKMDEWLSLTAAIISRLVKNTAVVTIPKPADCQFRHLELVSLQENLVLVVLVLRGARVRQRLLTFYKPITQAELTVLAAKISSDYSGQTASQIKSRETEPSSFEQQLNDCLVRMMQEEDEQEYNQSYLEGLHFMLNQPEFAHNEHILGLMELLEQRSLLGTILPQELHFKEVRVVIGAENKSEITRECSLVISRFGIPEEASGTLGVVGPTRMPYARVIAVVSYLSSLLSGLVAELYGVRPSAAPDVENKN
jgi:heat-inducible transcriptional repressor